MLSCEERRRASRQAYRERHPERDRENRKAAKARWIARNPEKHAEATRAGKERYRRENPEKVKESNHTQYAKDPDARIESAREWARKNPERRREIVNAWDSRNREGRRDYHLRRKYGLTLSEWKAKFEAQGGRCECCGSDKPGRGKHWHTDHDHETGVLRGILCGPCNVALSKHVTLERLQQMRNYLLRYMGH